MSLWPFYIVLAAAFAYCTYRFVKALIVNIRHVKDQEERINFYRQGLMSTSDLMAGNSKMLESNSKVMFWVMLIALLNVIVVLLRIFA